MAAATSPKQPHIVWILADQLTPQVLPAYSGSVVDAPWISRLAEQGTVFESAYCNSPLCAPSRASMLTGLLPSRIGAYDNGADFSSSVPTVAHRLRLAGYRTALAGKMHFVGPDQLHGFEQRLTTDVFGAGFEATPDWGEPNGGVEWEIEAVRTASPSTVTFQTEYDDEVTFAATRRLADAARAPDEGPLFLVASYTHPHDPFEPPPEHWERYADSEIDDPAVPRLSWDAADPHSRRLRRMYGLDQPGAVEIGPEQIRRARRAYYACISYLDDQIGALLQTLDRTGLADDTIVVFSSDHGEMLGERGLWYKLCFFEDSARVPLIVHDPRQSAGRRCAQVVSLVDLLPTMLDWAGAEPPAADDRDGHSLAPLVAGAGADWSDTALAENLTEAVRAPQVMIRRERHKFIHSPGDPDLLYDMSADGLELHDLAGDPDSRDLLAAFREEVAARWNLERLTHDVLTSQRRRRLVARALASGRSQPWEHMPDHPGVGRYLTAATDFWAHTERARLRRPP